MAIFAGSPHKRGQLVPSGLLHDHVQRFGVVSGYLLYAFESRAIYVTASMGPYHSRTRLLQSILRELTSDFAQ
jgi:hypothetical protein